MQPATVVGDRQRRLRLEEGVLHPLGVEHLVDGVGDAARAASTSPRRYFDTDRTLPSNAPYGVLIAVDGGLRVGERGQHVVLDLDQLGGGPGGLHVLGDHNGEHVAQVRGAARRPG